jgi:hypothetical protein
VGPQVVAVLFALLVIAAALYGAARVRAWGLSQAARVRAAEHHARLALHLARAGRKDTRRVLGSLGHAHGSLEFLALLMHEQRSILDRFDWSRTPAPVNDNDRSATSSRPSDVPPEPSSPRR